MPFFDTVQNFISSKSFDTVLIYNVISIVVDSLFQNFLANRSSRFYTVEKRSKSPFLNFSEPLPTMFWYPRHQDEQYQWHLWHQSRRYAFSKLVKHRISSPWSNCTFNFQVVKFYSPREKTWFYQLTNGSWNIRSFRRISISKFNLHLI